MADETPAPGGQPEQKAPEAPKKSRRGLIIIVLLILVIAGGAFYWHSTFSEDTDDAQINGHLIQISSRINGTVVKINVDENQYVAKGTVIAELDPADYQVAVENAEASLASAKPSRL